MELKEIQKLIDLVAKSGVHKLEIKRGDTRLLIQGHAEPTSAPQASSSAAPAVALPPPPTPAPAPVAATPPAPAETENAVAEDTVEVKAPLIGTFYRQPGPDKPAFVEVGDQFKAGDPLCVIEAMKIFNEVEAEFSGTIVKILVDDNAPVEYDQPLFLVKKS